MADHTRSLFYIGAAASVVIGAVAVATSLRRRESEKKAAGHERPKVGVGIIVQDPLTDKIIVGIRIGSHGGGSWHWPGGHLEYGETPQETASRELEEETGLVVRPCDIRVLGCTNDVHREEGKHYITICCYAAWDGVAQPRRMEENKCLGWHWKSFEEVRVVRPLFLPVLNFMAQPNFAPPEGARLARIRRHMHGRYVFLNGYPGSGKGTAGLVLASQLGLRHVSSGELFRKEAASGSEIGRQMDMLMRRGEILPPELTFDYLRKELARPEYQAGVLLDGYPKDLDCLAFILEYLGPANKPAAAVYFSISREEVQKRLLGRLACSGCERNYHSSLVDALPLAAGRCDACGSTLAPRADDSEATIKKRLDSFDQKTAPVTARLRDLGLLETIDASLSPECVTVQALEAIERRVCSRAGSGSWWASGGSALGMAPAAALSTKWHSHIDACDDATVLRIANGVSARVPTAQQKVYPISHLCLGPQYRAREFESIYCRLPNFHPIGSASSVPHEEAFVTTQMGEAGMDYAVVRATLEVCETFPRQGVMTEVEEDLWDATVDARGCLTVGRNDGDSKASIDWALLGEQWRRHLLTPCPQYELHHAINIPMAAGETPGGTPPLDLAVLAQRAAAEAGIAAGGWFIFEKVGLWAFRSNEFSNAAYGENLLRLQGQVGKLRSVVAALLAERGRGECLFTAACSLEKVHAIWRL